MALKENSIRKEQADQNRQTLIDATLDCIAEIGIAQTSVSEIIKRASLSRGMIQLHFGSKENLFVVAVKQWGGAYYDNLDEFLGCAGNTPQERLSALVNSDLDEKVLNKRSINVWYAFRGEARERELIANYSDTRDERLYNIMYRAVREIAEAEGLDDPVQVARDVTRGTLALLEGMWTDFLLHPDSFDRGSARRIVFRVLSSLFPRHFDLFGAVIELTPPGKN